VGSSVNLGRRFKDYYNYSSLTNPKNKMVINKALLKYGYSNFKLEILEYCEPENVIVREQHYMDLLKPEYNILQVAGSSFGYKHTEETLAKFRSRTYLPEHLAVLKENVKFLNSEEQRAKARERMLSINAEKGIKVEVVDNETNVTTTFDSIRKAAIALGCSKNAIHYYEKQRLKTREIKLLKGRYIINVIRS
jgi:group I intron endonuclease